MHVRGDIGTRLEESARNFAEVEKAIREIIPAEDLCAVVDNIGIPNSGINMSFNNTGTIGSQDGDIQIALNPGHRPMPEYVSLLRDKLPARFPGSTFSFLPADITSQILNFGAPMSIDLQIRGPKLDLNFDYAEKLLRKIRLVPGVADARIQQSRESPVVKVNVDRSRAQYVGVTERNVTESLGTSLSGTGQVSPTYWLNPKNGVSYAVVIQTPQYRLDSLAALQNVPVNSSTAPAPQILGGVASLERATTNAVVSQYDIQPISLKWAPLSSLFLIRRKPDGYLHGSTDGPAANNGRLGRTSYASSWGIVLALIIAIALAWAFFGNTSRTVDQTNTGASTTSEPVTTPSSPNASPTHPAPSPNPGP